MKKPLSSRACTLALVATVLCVAVSVFSCAKKPETNRVDMDQINYDDSTNYDLIFKDQIQKQKEKENRYKKDNF